VASVAALFEVRYGHSLEMNRMRPESPPGGVNFVGRAARNNGVTGRVAVPAGVTPGQPGELTVALGGQGGALSTFVQPEPFVCGRDVAILRARDNEMPLPEKIWWARCVSANRYRYGFGRQANRSLPSLVLPDNVPDFVKSAAVPNLAEARESLLDSPPALPEFSHWTHVTLEEVFEVGKGRSLTRRQREPGRTPFVGATMRNNGVTDYVSVEPMFHAPSISVPYNGNGVAYAFLQEQPFAASDDVQVLTPRSPVPRAALLFTCAVIRRERYRFSYGRKWHLERMRRNSISLPAHADGEVAWRVMADYINSLRFSRGALGSTADL
jgi:hypothetical protein